MNDEIDNTYPSVPEFAANTSNTNPRKNYKKLILILIAIFGVAVLTGVSVFAYNTLTGSSSGADTPEGVLTNVSNAFADKDLTAVLSAGDPNEIEPFIENLSLFTKEAEKSGSIKNAKNPLEAYSIKFSNMKTQTYKYSDTVARVELINGEIVTKVDKSKLPKGSSASIKSETINIEKSNKDYIETLKDFNEDFEINKLESKHIFYIAVKRGDQWYVSSLYTATEYVRMYFKSIGEDIDAPSFDEKDRVGNGAPDSNTAVKNFLDAIVGYNPSEMINATAPDRFSIGYDYKKTLLKLQKDNKDNQYLKITEDTVTITDLKTTAEPNGKEREFNKIDNVKVKLKYNIDVKKGEESDYIYFPYATNVKASWDGRCYAYSGEIKNFEEVILDDNSMRTYDDDDAPYTDAEGIVYQDTFDIYNATYPIVSKNGRIYPDSDSLYFGTYRPLPWKDSEGNIIFDAQGNKVVSPSGDYEADEQENYPWKDSSGIEIYDSKGSESYTKPDYTYVKNSDNIDDKNCYSKKDLKDLPDFGFVTIKEKSKYYVSPIDTIWYYVIWGVQNSK